MIRFTLEDPQLGQNLALGERMCTSLQFSHLNSVSFRSLCLENVYCEVVGAGCSVVLQLVGERIVSIGCEVVGPIEPMGSQGPIEIVSDVGRG